MRATISLFVVTAISLASCASHPPKKDNLGYSSNGQVQDQSYVPDDAKHYPEVPGAVYLKIVPGPENVMPVYPEQLLSKKLPPVVVTAKAIVNSGGTVDSAEIIDGDWYNPLFNEATLNAIKTWHFTPLRRVVSGKTEFLPTTEHFVFVFSQVNGKAIVKPGA